MLVKHENQSPLPEQNRKKTTKIYKLSKNHGAHHSSNGVFSNALICLILAGCLAFFPLLAIFQSRDPHKNAIDDTEENEVAYLLYHISQTVFPSVIASLFVGFLGLCFAYIGLSYLESV